MLVGLRFEPRDPLALHFAFGSAGSPLTRFLLRQDLPFAADARIINGDAVPRAAAWGRILAESSGDADDSWHAAPPVHDLFRSPVESETRSGGGGDGGGGDGGGGWAQLTLRRCSAPSRASNRTCDVDAVVHADDGRLLSVRAYHVPAHGVEQLAPAQVADLRLARRWRPQGCPKATPPCMLPAC